MCQELTSIRGNNLAEPNSCCVSNSKTTELQQQWTSNPLKLSSCEATSPNANPSPPPPPCLFPQALLPLTIQFPPSSVFPTTNKAIGIVHPIFKNTPLNDGGCDNSPSLATTIPEIKINSNLAPTPICAVCKASDIIPQLKCVGSGTGVEPLQSNILGTTLPYNIVNTAGAPNSAQASGPNPLQKLNSLQIPPKYSFQFPKVDSEETTSPTLPIYGQKPNSPLTAATYSLFTEPLNVNLCSPNYFQNAPSKVISNVDPINITPVSLLPGCSLPPPDTQDPQIVFLVASNTPTETKIVQNKDEFDTSVKDGSSAVVLPEENYGNIEILNAVNSYNGNAIDVPTLDLDAKSDAANSQWPLNLVINVPSVNVPAPSVTILPLPSCSSALSECAPVVPSFIPIPMMPIIVNSSKSKFQRLLPLILTSLLRDRVSCQGGCSCNCGTKSIPIPYPIPISTRCANKR